MSMNSPEIKEFIRQHSNLFWYIPEDKKEEISNEVLVEFIFNYGDMNDVRKLIKFIGMERLSEIFSGLQGRKILNYYPEIYNFFSILIKRYAH
jgi:two-component SAPR family response regulator